MGASNISIVRAVVAKHTYREALAVNRMSDDWVEIVLPGTFSGGLMNSLPYWLEERQTPRFRGKFEIIFADDRYKRCLNCDSDRPKGDFPFYQFRAGGKRKDVCNRCNVNLNAKKNRDPLKQKARQETQKTIKAGLLVSPDRCEGCQKEWELYRDGTPLRHVHHLDYSRPLDILWLCPDCHSKRHRSPQRRLREGLISKEEHDRLIADEASKIPISPAEARMAWLD